MVLEGDTSVIDALKEKKRLMEAGEEHGHIRPLVIVDGGFMQGAYAVGAGVAFEELGFTDVFSNVVGMSGGAISAAYFIAGEVYKGKRLIIEECCDSRFFSWWRLFGQEDSSFLIDSVKSHPEKALSVERLLASKTTLHIGVTEYETGKPVLLQPSTATDLYAALGATVSMPTVCTQRYEVAGVRYVDGCFSSPYIIEATLGKIPATHILIFMSRDKNYESVSFTERLLNRTIFRSRFSSPLLKSANVRSQSRSTSLQRLRSDGIPYALIWGDGSIGPLERSSEKVLKVIDHSARWWRDLLINNSNCDTRR